MYHPDALSAFRATLTNLYRADAIVAYLKSRGFDFGGVNGKVAFRKAPPDTGENALLVELFFNYGFRGYHATRY